jgi:hypothetical protein
LLHRNKLGTRAKLFKHHIDRPAAFSPSSNNLSPSRNMPVDCQTSFLTVARKARNGTSLNWECHQQRHPKGILMRLLFLVALALPAAPLLAQSAPTLTEGWAPGGKTPVKHYRIAGETAGCDKGYRHVPAGKGLPAAEQARDATCGAIADRAPQDRTVQAD